MILAPIDIVVFLVFMLFSIYVAWFSSKNVSELDDFTVAGRNLGPFVLAATFGATNFSTWSMVGKPGMVYNTGISVVWIALNAMACVMAAVIFSPIYRKLQYVTMAEIFEDRYDGKVRSLISVIWIIADTLNRYGVTIYASAVIMSLLFKVDINVFIIIMAVLCWLYTYFGGLQSVALTDAAQFAMMWLGLFFGAIFVLGEFGGWAGLSAQVPSNITELVPDINSGTGWPWILAMTLLGFPYFITSQFVMQRGLAAKTVNVARWGLLLAGLLAIPMAIMEVIPGIAARAMFTPENIAGVNPDMIGPMVYTKILPPGILGIFFSAMLAAGLSTADSALLSSSSLIVNEFYTKFYPGRSNNHYLYVNRITTLILSALGVAWALIVPKLGGAVDAILNVVAITDMPVFVVICLGLFVRKINALGALFAIILGTIAGTVASVYGLGGIQGLAFTTAASTITALVAGLLVSNVTKKTDAEQKRSTEFFDRIKHVTE
ncbi:MAG: sodium:solute symporter family protein [Thermoanaerobacteraceae bacterium]|nr:sodium:solute symporter family protein [Thermoanaerobacteraceae bacterium]